ncbi:lysM domain-containing protein [Colletotrichum higginsianum]|nr:lysM domain-containing protein [Colletotrichum higginsianum]
MATSSQPAGPLDEGPPYRSFEELRGDPTVAVVFTAAAKRLFWPLDGVFPTALSRGRSRAVLPADPRRRRHLARDRAAALTEPKVSSVEASVYDLEQWEFNWVAWHTHHEGEPANPEYVTYGDLSDEDRPYAKEPKEDGSWEEDSDTEFLVRCCGQDRPLRKRGQKLVVTPAAGGHFVTTHDYVSGESSFGKSWAEAHFC